MAVRSLFENQRLRTRFPTFGDNQIMADCTKVTSLLDRARTLSSVSEASTLARKFVSTSWTDLNFENTNRLAAILDEIANRIKAFGVNPFTGELISVELNNAAALSPQKVVLNYSTPLPTVSTVALNPSFAPDPAPMNSAPRAAPPSNNPTGMTDADYAALVEKNKAESAALANAYRNAPTPDANVNSQANDNIQNDPAPLNPASSGPASSTAPTTTVSPAPSPVIPEVKPKSLILPLAATIAAYLLIKG